MNHIKHPSHLSPTLQASYLCTLLLLISSATPSSSNTEKGRSGSLGQHPHKRLARSPQTFGNSFDPIPADEVREHFAAGEDFIDPGLGSDISDMLDHQQLLVGSFTVFFT